MIKQVLTFSTLLMMLFMAHGTAQDAFAQPMGQNFGIGGQLGEPSGLSIEYYPGRGVFGSDSYEFLLWWDTDDDFDHFAANIHALFDRPLSGAPVKFYYGPGFFIGFFDRHRDDTDVYAGISGQFGLSFDIDRFEIFGHLTPRLVLAPDTDGDLGGGIGARFYF